MVQINFATREINCKIVYYGPGMSGKTTNLEMIHKKAPPQSRGEMTTIATEGDRTLFFDFLPIDLGTAGGMKTNFQIYTVPGQSFYSSTRKVALQGADGVVFVADSQYGKMAENVESLKDLQTNLMEYRLDLKSIPVVLQWNKRDLPDIMSVELMNEKLNPLGVPAFEAIAVQGDGVMETLKKLTSMVLDTVNEKDSKPTERRRPRYGPDGKPTEKYPTQKPEN